GLPVEVECRNSAEVDAALAAGADRLLLDNMDLDGLRAAVAARDRAGSGARLEASGGVGLDTIGATSATGVDFISVGALTHSAPALDLSMLLEASLLEKPRQSAVGEHLAAGLLVRAVAGDPLRVVDRGDRGAGARGRVALAAGGAEHDWRL